MAENGEPDGACNYEKKKKKFTFYLIKKLIRNVGIRILVPPSVTFKTNLII